MVVTWNDGKLLCIVDMDVLELKYVAWLPDLHGTHTTSTWTEYYAIQEPASIQRMKGDGRQY